MTVATRPGGQMERLLFEIKKVIVGQDHLLERIVVALLARGHLLVEGVPGLAKTLQDRRSIFTGQGGPHSFAIHPCNTTTIVIEVQVI